MVCFESYGSVGQRTGRGVLMQDLRALFLEVSPVERPLVSADFVRPGAALMTVAAFGGSGAAQPGCLRMSEEVSIIGFNDLPESSWSPPLATVRQPLAEMGALARLDRAPAGPGRPDRDGSGEAATDLVARDSAARLPANDHAASFRQPRRLGRAGGASRYRMAAVVVHRPTPEGRRQRDLLARVPAGEACWSEAAVALIRLVERAAFNASRRLSSGCGLLLGRAATLLAGGALAGRQHQHRLEDMPCGRGN